MTADFAARAHSDPDAGKSLRGSGLKDMQENDQELEEGHGKRFIGDREHDSKLKI